MVKGSKHLNKEQLLLSVKGQILCKPKIRTKIKRKQKKKFIYPQLAMLEARSIPVHRDVCQKPVLLLAY